MPFFRTALLLSALVVSVCALLSVVSAVDTCTFTLYQDNACAGRPVSAATTVSGIAAPYNQCVPSADGVSSQWISHFGPQPGWNISYAYFQVEQAALTHSLAHSLTHSVTHLSAEHRKL